MPTYPTGLTAANAIAMVRNRTGQTAGQPADGVIQTFLNAALETVERRIGAIYANQSIAIAQGSDTVALPADMQSLINVNFSITLPTATNAMLYPIQLVQEGAFERLVGFAPGQTAGYPTLAFVQSDASGIMTLQLYPVPNANGFINCYYMQRPQQYTDTSGSVTQLDSMFQEAMIVEACMRVCENRAMYGDPVKYFAAKFEQVLEQINEDAKRRQLPQRNQVADVMESGASNIPYWYQGFD